MKKILFIIAVILSSCSADRQSQDEQQNCTCETVLTASTFTLPNGYTKTVVTVENDCTGAQRQRDLVGVYTVGQRICN